MLDYKLGQDHGSKIIVGVNKYTIDEETPIPILTHDPKVTKVAIERLRRWREDRGRDCFKESLNNVEEAAQAGRELTPLIVEAVRCKATIGEITEALCNVFGEYKHPPILAYR